jgi:caa(3)-type oxidase subunit IV
MRQQLNRYLLIWLGLMALAVLEFAASLLPMPPEARPMLVLPAMVMAVLVSLYMRLPGAPQISRGFAVAGVFWLVVLLSLVMMDPLTRVVYAVPQ